MRELKVLKPFHDGPSGRLVHEGDTVFASEERHEALWRNGLVHREPVTKAAPAPENKAAPVPANKNEATPAVRRGPGRPPKVR